MNSGGEEHKTRDPFQLELLQAVHKRRQRTEQSDENNNHQHFDAALNAKMSKYSTKYQTDAMKKPQYIFDSKEDDDDADDNVMSGNRGLNKNVRSTDPSVSQKSHPNNLKNSMERDSFLNAFLDRDANLKHEPFPFKSHKDANETKSKSPTPTPAPRPRNKEITESSNSETFKTPGVQTSKSYDKYSHSWKEEPKPDNGRQNLSAESSMTNDDTTKNGFNKKSYLSLLNENKETENNSTDIPSRYDNEKRTLEKSRKNDFDKYSNLNPLNKPDFNEKADVKNIIKGQDKIQSKTSEKKNRVEEKEEQMKYKIPDEKSTGDKSEKYPRSKENISQVNDDALSASGQRRLENKKSSKHADDEKYANNITKFNKSLGAESSIYDYNKDKSQKTLSQNVHNFETVKETFKKGEKSPKVINRGKSPTTTDREKSLKLPDREKSPKPADRERSPEVTERGKEKEKKREAQNLPNSRESSFNEKRINEITSPGSNMKPFLKEKDFGNNEQVSENLRSNGREPSLSGKQNDVVSSRSNKNKNQNKSENLQGAYQENQNKEVLLPRTRKSDFKDKSPLAIKSEGLFENDELKKNQSLSPRNNNKLSKYRRNTESDTCSKNENQIKTEISNSFNGNDDINNSKSTAERKRTENFTRTDSKRQKEEGGEVRDNRPQTRNNNIPFDKERNNKESDHKTTNDKLDKDERISLKKQLSDSRRHYEEDQNKNDEKQYNETKEPTKSKKSFDDVTSPHHRVKLKKQESLDSPRNKTRHLKEEGSKDEDIDDLFDAGSRKMSIRSKNKNIETSKDLNSPVKGKPVRLDGGEEKAKGKQNTGKKKKLRTETESIPRKKGPMRASLPLELATKSPILKNTAKKTSGNKPLSASHMGKSSSFTNISNIKPSSCSKSSSSYDMSTMDAGTLREQIYVDWLQRKNSFTKEDKKKVTEKKKEEGKEKERLKKERIRDAQKSFEVWADRKTEVLQSRKHERKLKTNQENEKDDEKLQKQLEAKKYFESWKQRKDEELKEKFDEKKKDEKQKKNKELSDKMERTEDAKKIFDKWKSQKDEKLKEVRSKKHLTKKTIEEEELDKQERKQQAQRSYEAWKEKAATRPSSPKLKQRPWCPSSRQRSSGIPDEVQPVIVRNPPPGSRNRTMSASSRLQNNSKRSK